MTGTAAAERAGCPVLVVPNDVEVPEWQAATAHFFAGRYSTAADLRAIHSQLITQFGERTA